MSASVNRSRPSKANAIATPDGFLILGGSKLAYIRVARSEDVALFCPQAPLLAPGQEVFVLCAADGTPILVTDTRASAIENAQKEELEAVSLH